MVLSFHPEEQYALRVLKAGGSGYVTKSTAPDELVMAMKRALTGGTYVSSVLAEQLAAGRLGHCRTTLAASYKGRYLSPITADA